MAKTYTTVPDKGVRDQFSEAMWDTHLKDNINNLILPPSCRVTHSTTQSIANNTDTARNWDTETFDTDGMHDNVTNNERLTPTTAGLYVVTGSTDFAVNATGYRYGQINLNAATTLALNVCTPGTTSITGWINTSVIYAANGSTDFFAYRVAQNSGAALNSGSAGSVGSFQAVWVGRTS